MSNESVPKTIAVWGRHVVVQACGRRVWSEDIKREAIERMGRGQSAIQIANELGTTAALVHKWRRPSAGDMVDPGFVEVVPVAIRAVAVRKPDCAPTVCLLRLGDVELTVQPGYPFDHLSEILRAVRVSL